MMSESDREDVPDRNPLRAVAGVIERNGLILIGRRLPEDSWGGLWEFPGGKIEPGETTEDCLARELMEELGVETRVGERLCVVQPSDRFHLTVHRVEILSGEPELREHTDLRWVEPERLEDFDMLPANRPVIGYLLGRQDDVREAS